MDIIIIMQKNKKNKNKKEARGINPSFSTVFISRRFGHFRDLISFCEEIELGGKHLLDCGDGQHTFPDVQSTHRTIHLAPFENFHFLTLQTPCSAPVLLPS